MKRVININKQLSDNIVKKINKNMSNKIMTRKPESNKKVIKSVGKIVDKKQVKPTKQIISVSKIGKQATPIAENKKVLPIPEKKQTTSIPEKNKKVLPIPEKKENISPILEKNINVPPDKLGDVKGYISSYLDNNFIGKIDKNNGYISSVNIINIKKHIISRITSDIIYRVTFSIDNNKPEVDKEYTVPVNAITDTYILCKKDLIYFFVCKDELDKMEYKHNKVDNTYNKIIVKEGKKVKRKIYIDKDINLKIKTFQLNKDENGQNYICICTIV